MKEPCVYITTNKPHGTLYTGVTSDLLKRIDQHKQKLMEGFTKKYNVTQLVYFEMHESMMEAIKREKQLKRWRREWKIKLIEKGNPLWCDLYEGLMQ